jgi:hypothetical protein
MSNSSEAVNPEAKPLRSIEDRLRRAASSQLSHEINEAIGPVISLVRDAGDPLTDYAKADGSQFRASEIISYLEAILNNSLLRSREQDLIDQFVAEVLKIKAKKC